MKLFSIPCTVVLAILLVQSVAAQDNIQTKTGKEIKSRVLKVNRKQVVYKNYEDPEFNTYAIPYDSLKTVKYEEDKKPIYFNHKLPRAYIVGGFGPSIALGALSKKNFEDAGIEPGFAKLGVNSMLEAGFYLYRRIGLTISTGYYWNNYNYDANAEALGSNEVTSREELQVFEGNNQPFDTTGGNSNSRSLNSWDFGYVMLGPIYSFKASKRITLDLKGKFGFTSITKPSISTEYRQYDDDAKTILVRNDRYDYYSSERTVFTFGFGAATRIALTKRLAFYLSADYRRSSANFSFNTLSYSFNSTGFGNISPVQGNASVLYTFSSLNLTAGIAFQFKRKGNKYE